MTEIRISVRRLVEFLLRSGNLESGEGVVSYERALEGARIHRRLQKEAGDSYRAEVPFSHTEEWEKIRYTVEGRADGLFEEDGVPVIDEIKTVSLPLSRLPRGGDPLHWAQAKCYAYFYACDAQAERVAVRLTYCQAESGELLRLQQPFEAGELADFFHGLLHQYAPWARFRCEWRETRDASAKALAFPFPQFRPGQRQMAAAVYRAVRDGKRLFCQAPTGVGKTISTLFPAVKAMGEGLAGQIFYLTAKTVAGRAAAGALNTMRTHGLHLKSVHLTAKEKICCLETPSCTPLSCPRALGHYDRINEALYEILTSADCLDREAVSRAAEAHRVCPFEMALDLSEWCDVIVCDYNYLFDPTVNLKRYFSEKKGDYVFLIDEAHNLPDRGRDMYTAELAKSEVLALRRQAGKGEKSLWAMLGRLNSALLALRSFCGEDGTASLPEIPEDLLPALRLFSLQCGEWLESHREHPLRHETLSLWFSVRFFLRIADLYGPEYVTQLRHRGSEVIVRLLCLDASRFLDASMAKGRAAVLFSATLSPPAYFVSVLGGGEEARTLSVPSPFPPENLLLLQADRISTRYADRAASVEPVAALIRSFARGSGGHTIAFFPSYEYMESVADRVVADDPELETVRQGRNMSEEDRAAFLDRFSSGPSGVLLGFCVMGGVFAEGVDLVGNRLSGAVIVGVGLPKVSRRQELLRAYYERERGDGFSYAYRYPGMNKVMQAAGRVIRSETDRGAVLLIDSRFSQWGYRSLFPAHWQPPVPVRTAEEVSRALRAFYQSSAAPEEEKRQAQNEKGG